MLVVTGVNRCPYCARYHGWRARAAGVSDPEIADLLAGGLDAAPERERGALCFALHGAERDALPEPRAREDLRREYGQDAEAIEAALHLIRIGNLLGNLFRRGAALLREAR
jgi:AhpD family alkylhydroperoxidase